MAEFDERSCRGNTRCLCVLKDEKVRGIILKHGIPELYEKLERFIRKE